MSTTAWPAPVISITAARAERSCGCASWLEWDDDQDAWVARSHACYRHQG